MLQIPELENRQLEIFDIAWFKIIELEMKITFQEILEKRSILDGGEESPDERSPQSDIIDILIEEKAEKKIHDLFYLNYIEIFKFAEKKLGIKHEISSKSITTLNILKQIRHAYVHGDGSLNHITLKKLKMLEIKIPISQKDIGAKITFNDKFLKYSQNFFNHIARKFDKAFLMAYPELAETVEIFI